MGFPGACPALILPNFVVQTLSILELIRTLILTFFNLVGLSSFFEPEFVRVNPQTMSFPSRPGFGSVPVSVIRELLPVVKFSEIVAGAGEYETPESCAVCLHDFEPQEEIRRLRNCRHVFHRCCVDRWIEHDQMTCPLCRTPFLSAPEIQVHQQDRILSTFFEAYLYS